MPTFILTINWTDQGVRAVRDAPKRSEAARELAQKVGVDIKHIYLTSGEHDLLVIAEAPLSETTSPNLRLLSVSIGKRAYPHLPSLDQSSEWAKLISELP